MTNEELVERIRAGIDVGENMAQLYRQSRAFIHTIALRYQGRADLEDLEQEGYLALYPAIDGYDAKTGYKFLTYAKYHIRQRMQRYLWKNSPGPDISSGCFEKIQKYRAYANTYQMEHGHTPSDREAAAALYVTIHQINNIRKSIHMVQAVRLDGLIMGTDGEESVTLSDLIEAPGDLQAESMERIGQEELKAVIWNLVDELPGKAPAVVRMRYQEGLTLKESGERIGINIEAARQCENKAIRELRKPSRARKLLPFLDEYTEGQAYRGGGVEVFNRTWTSSTERVALEL